MPPIHELSGKWHKALMSSTRSTPRAVCIGLKALTAAMASTTFVLAPGLPQQDCGGDQALRRRLMMIQTFDERVTTSTSRYLALRPTLTKADHGRHSKARCWYGLHTSPSESSTETLEQAHSTFTPRPSHPLRPSRIWSALYRSSSGLSS